MGYGFQVIGSHGVTQIDETYANHMLYQSGTVALNNLASLPSGLLFIRIPYGGSVGYLNQTSVLDYRVYREANSLGAGNQHGLRVYGPSGQMFFDGAYRPLKVLSVINAIAYYGATTPAYASRPWVSYHVFGPQGLLAGPTFNEGYTVGQIATQNGNNSVTFVQDVIGAGPPVSQDYLYDGYMTYLLGD